jgi:hypothetical protein
MTMYRGRVALPRIGWFLLRCIVLFVAAAAAFGQSAPAVKLQVQPQQAAVGDPIRLDLQISAPAGSRITVPNPGSQIGDLSVLEFQGGPTVPAGTSAKPAVPPGVIGHEARIVVAAYKTGEYEVPAISVAVQTPDGKNLEIKTQPVKIRIESILAKDDQDPKELKKQAEIQEPVRWIFWAALISTLLLLAAVAAWLWGRRTRKVPEIRSRPQIDPLDAAEAELRDLAGRGMLEKGLLKPYYVALSDILKRALDAGFGIPTREKTTSEIMDGLRAASPAPKPETLDFIEALLLDCDLVKFAKYIPSERINQGSLHRAFEIVEICKRNRVPAAGPAPVVESV